jgi:hypothetical protein
VRKSVKPAVSNWQRPLPRPIVLPDVPLTLSTLADVRTLVQKRLPSPYREKTTWRQVATVTAAAARGQLPTDEVSTALRLVLKMEGISCRPQ